MRQTSPRVVVMRNGSAFESGGAQYLQKDGTWGAFKTARRFKTDADADSFCEPGGHGIFPVSRPRWLRKS